MSTSKTLLAIAIAIIISLFLTNCSKEDSGNDPSAPSTSAKVEKITLSANGINYDVDTNPFQASAFLTYLKTTSPIPSGVKEVTIEVVTVSSGATSTLKVGDKKQISPDMGIDFSVTASSGLKLNYTIEPEFVFPEFTVEDFEVEPTPINPSKGFQTIIDFFPIYSTPDITEECFHSNVWGTYGYDGWGLWDVEKNFDPRMVDDTGRRDIQPRMYPQIGLYDVNDPIYQDYLALILKTAGIDIFSYRLDLRWVLGGRTPDRCKFSTASVDGYMQVMEEAEVPFMLTVSVNAPFSQFGFDVPTEEQASVALEEMANYLEQNFFSRSNYHQINGLPALRLTSNIKEEFLDNFAQIFDGKAFYFVDGQDVFDAINTSDKTNGDLENGGLIGFPGFSAQLPEGEVFQSVNDVLSVYRDGDLLRNNLEGLLETLGAEYISMTWNNYGNSNNAVRLCEPTLELGSHQMTLLSEMVGTNYSDEVFKVCTDYYIKRKAFKSNELAQKQLDQIKQYLLSNQIDKAIQLNNDIGS